MSEATFFQVLEPDPADKGTRLKRLVRKYRSMKADEVDDVYALAPSNFSAVPTSAFSYQYADVLRSLASSGQQVSDSHFRAVRGLGAGKARHVYRLIWEPAAHKVGASEQWYPMNNGGPYSPFYYPIDQVVLAQENSWSVLTSYKSGVTTGQDWFGHPGLGYGKRTDFMYSFIVPEGVAFTDEGQAIFPVRDFSAWKALGITNCELFGLLLNEFTAQHKHSGYVNGMRWPTEVSTTIGDSAESAYGLCRRLDSLNETSTVFRTPFVSNSSFDAGLFQDTCQEVCGDVSQEVRNIDRACYEDVLGEVPDGRPIERYTDYCDVFFNYPREAAESLWVGNLIMWCIGVAFGRWDVRMARDSSLVPELPGAFEGLPRVAPGGLVGPDGLPATQGRIASDAWLRARADVNTLPEPGDVEGDARVRADQYPIDVAWDGVLVDDPGHPRDIVSKVREVLRYLYGAGRAEAIEEEALEILRADGRTPGSLRDWLRNRTATELGRNFFDFHVRRYSKSRRKAPIYWRLCSNPDRDQSQYAVWLYYDRLTDDTLWTVLNSYLGPKLERVEQRTEKLRSEIEKTEGSESRRLEKEREEALDLLEEFRWFEGELRKVAESGWRPELDDGVVINVAPFHKVMRWNEPEKHWKRLEKGEYDWSMTAMRHWPDRVREKCQTDRSLAIAHGLEGLYEGE